MSESGTPLIRLSGLTKVFTTDEVETHALSGIHLEIQKGEYVAIAGPSGCGKSTLLSILGLLDSPTSGTYTLNGAAVQSLDFAERARIRNREIGFIFQSFNLIGDLTVYENVELPLTYRSTPPAERRERTQQALERVGLGNAINRRPRQLSGGMRQRVAIARALATDPQVLFLDEPFGALDALTRETLQQDLARLCAEGDRPVTTVMITNNVEEAILLSDRIVPMLPGKPLSDVGGRAPSGVEARAPSGVEGATLGPPIDVALPRPRSAAQLAHDEDATHVRAHVVATLTAAVVRRGSSSATRAAAIELAALEETR